MSHVEKRGKKSWRLVVTIGYDADGKPIRERETVEARNKTEAEKKLTIFESKILTGQYVKPEKMKLKKLYEEWKENVSLGERTKKEYENIWDARIIPLYGHMNAPEIKPIHISNFIKSLQKDGARLDGKEGKLSTSTVNNCYKAFNSVLQFGVDMTWLTHNPAKNIKPPTVQHAETEIYTPKEISILISGLEKLVTLEKRVLVAIALSTSARQGEIVALEEKHCDFERNGIYIKQALIVIKGVGVVLKETKTKKKRFISLPKMVMNMLRKIIHIKKQELFKAGDKREWKKHTFLFSNEFGKPIRPDSISQWWNRFKESDKFETLGLNTIRFHDLRHSSLTYLSSRGLRLKAVQGRAGHAKIGTTFDIYGHILPEEDLEAAGYVEEMFEKNPN